MVRSSLLRVASTALVVLAIACGDDDDPSLPPPDAGIGSMMLTVAGQTAIVDSVGRLVTGDVSVIQLGPSPVGAAFFNQDGSPATAVTPDRYDFNVVSGDTLAIKWQDGPGFTGTLTANAGGRYTSTFRLIDGNNDGVEIFYSVVLQVDLAVTTLRMVVGADTTDIDATNTVPDVLMPVGTGEFPVEVLYLGEDDQPSPAVTTDVFYLAINSSDTNVVRWEAGDGFTGTLTGVAPGVASIAVRLRSIVNDDITLAKTLTVVVR
jgi:hypothetical protein